MFMQLDSSDHVLLSKAQMFIEYLLLRGCVSDDLFPPREEFFDRYDPVIRRFARACGTADADLVDAAQTSCALIVDAFLGLHCDPSKGRSRSELFMRVRRSAVSTLRLKAAIDWFLGLYMQRISCTVQVVRDPKWGKLHVRFHAVSLRI